MFQLIHYIVGTEKSFLGFIGSNIFVKTGEFFFFQHSPIEIEGVKIRSGVDKNPVLTVDRKVISPLSWRINGTEIFSLRIKDANFGIFSNIEVLAAVKGKAIGETIDWKYG